MSDHYTLQITDQRVPALCGQTSRSYLTQSDLTLQDATALCELLLGLPELPPGPGSWSTPIPAGQRTVTIAPATSSEDALCRCGHTRAEHEHVSDSRCLVIAPADELCDVFDDGRDYTGDTSRYCACLAFEEATR